MRFILKKYFAIMASLFIVSQVISGLVIRNGWSAFLYASLILSVLFVIVKPLVNLFLLPINLLTLNLAAWILNILVIFVWDILLANVTISSWTFPGLEFGLFTLSSFYLSDWQVVIAVAIFFTIINRLLYWLID